jgi:RnfABCDGE-type electron transport complex B subunit
VHSSSITVVITLEAPFDAIIIFSVLSLILGLILGYAAIKFKIDGNPLVDQIDALLPQTQCGQCDFAGCRPYAEAIAKGEAQINQCPPGGQDGVDALAELLDVETLLLNCWKSCTAHTNNTCFTNSLNNFARRTS